MNMTIEQIGADIGVKRLLSLYATYVDSRQLDKALALFAPDALLVLNGEEKQGSSAIKAWIDTLANSPAGIHMTTNTVVTVDSARPDHAQARSDVGYIRKLADGWKVLAAGRYIDTCEFKNGS